MSNTACDYTADYSLVAGERSFPYVISLNLNNSILSPQAGSHQTFCYDIEGNATTSDSVSLSYFILGLCPNIGESDIASVAITLGGIPQTVIWGQNIVLKNISSPDPATGCSGLKVVFPLDPANGNMQVTITLKNTYDVGAMPVCLYGAESMASGLSICGPVCGNGDSCESVVYQNETVCVPVTVTPYAKTGNATTVCCGTPTVTAGGTCTGGASSCSFSITQSLCVAIPVAFGAAVKTGTAVVSCGSADATCGCSNTGRDSTGTVTDSTNITDIEHEVSEANALGGTGDTLTETAAKIDISSDIGATTLVS
jgi:hypothetical protein